MKIFSQPSGVPVRRSAVAGRFYDAVPSRLARSVDDCLLGAEEQGGPVPKAIIAPHAGYIYSGPIAGSAFKAWQNPGTPIRTVVLLGPAHYESFSGMALSEAYWWETPLGKIEVNQAGIDQLRTSRAVRFFDAAHEPEHCLEVELPFLQRLWPNFTIVPVLVGDADPAEVAAVIERLWGGPETVFVISSDLSHFLDYPAAQALDRVTAEAIAALEPERIETGQACGRLPIQGLLEVARRKKLAVRTLDLRNSGDTAGSRDRVVGYGAFAFCAPR